ncbi:dexamethasone-induced Ras-related protein 1-like [Saccoglossus kowalevskii]|uniref:Dexamethasone-induced Ras-related protein 1-like n=1 Tax=Saccoglossus kowalevskii TaxID=10224 RepID=A0ABM0GRF7_SACKO|nr:PREDICTED: dexamethasone-induced Ras-related protein 1-like [Saccoglossus kowalevskii]
MAMSQSVSTQIVDSEMNALAKNCYRLVMLGTAKVGKTAIVNRFLENRFDESYTPTIEDFHRKIYKIKGEVYRLDILDTSGNNPFPAMERLSLLTGDIFILVYSVDNRASYEEVLRIREQILQTKGSKRSISAVPMVIAGNKCDKESRREVRLEDVRRTLGSARKCSFYETSAKKNINIDMLFQALFEHAKMPNEMSPALHRKISATTSPNLSTNSRGVTLRRKISDACGVIAPHARRPSLRSDLMAVNAKLRQSRDMEQDEDDGRKDRCALQ